jgi:uncharacterized protein
MSMASSEWSPRRDPEPEVATWHPVGPAVPGPVPPQDPASDKPLPFNWFSSLPELRRDRKTWNPRDPTHWIAAIVLWGVIVLLVAGLLLETLGLVAEVDAQPLDPATMALALIINTLMFVGVPFLWVAIMYYGDSWRAIQHRLLLRTDSPGKDIAIGLGVGFLGLGITIVVTLIFEALGWMTENPVVEQMGPQLTWALVFFIPVMAAVSEEVFFRGFLQPRIGMVGANVLFGFVHISYQTPLQVIVPMMLGFLFSWTMLRRRSLLPAIVGHFIFNFVALSLVKLSHDLGWEVSTVSFW